MKPSELIKREIEMLIDENYNGEQSEKHMIDYRDGIFDQMAEDIDRLKGMVTGLYIKNALAVQNEFTMTELFQKREWEK